MTKTSRKPVLGNHFSDRRLFFRTAAVEVAGIALTLAGCQDHHAPIPDAAPPPRPQPRAAGDAAPKAARLAEKVKPTVAKAGSIAERVTQIVAEQFGVDQSRISLKTSFVKDLGGDSLDCVELVMELEEEFDISIPDDEAVKLQTVEQAAACVERLQQRKP